MHNLYKCGKEEQMKLRDVESSRKRKRENLVKSYMGLIR